MDLSQIPLFKAITRRLGFDDARQRVLSQNIANIDTPDYKPKDLKAPDFAHLAHAELGRLAMATTNPRDIVPASTGSAYRAEKDKGAYETTVSGNSVSLEQELFKIAKTTFDHQTMIDLYRKQVNLIKTAIDKGGS
ncbi:MAG TPA: flagellar basal body rod protein FlgB [Alphaproteobacteria bacterium]|nr:flagellar basal body rod protein FlgB [Alphaproteobacteria bacterium]